MVFGGMLGRVPGLVSGRMPGRVLSFAPDVERMVSFPLAKGVNMSSLLYIFSTLQPQTKVYHFRGYPIPSHKFCGGGGRLLYWATSRCCKCQSCCSKCQNPCAQRLCSGVLLGSFFPMLLCGGGPATMRRCHLHLCHGTPAILPRLFGQQQTSFGAPGQSLRHCALASLSAPAPWPATFSRWRSATAAPLTRRSATAPWPATNLIRRRKVLRLG